LSGAFVEVCRSQPEFVDDRNGNTLEAALNGPLVACADTPAAAVTLAEEVEWLAGTYLRALALG
jgi:ribulose-5-phosphate 4-epimerase/fuculose-1-phosphate aldolase